jgi:ubiquinone biosynthesis protein
MARVRQISTVFAKWGFQELMQQLGFGRFVPRRYRALPSEPKLSTPERLRRALEELGPTFIKLGQVLSSRSDLLPENFVKELTKLQDRASPLPYAVIRNTVERELGAPIAELFADFSEIPLASASIGQAHGARLRSGEEVVVKVQRPGIETLIRTDVAVLTGLAAAVEKYFPEWKTLGPQIVVEEFFQAMRLELDFILEAHNILKSQKNLKDFPSVRVPKVYLELCSPKVLVVERFVGFKLDDSAAIEARQLPREKMAENLAKAFLKTALEDGFFHGDLHPGNLFALAGNPGQECQIGMIDFGIMGYLTPRARESLVRIFLALSEEDFETLCLEFAELGASRGATDFDSFQRAIQTTVGPHLGLALGSLNVGKLLIEATTVAARHRIRIPREWMLIFKAIYTLEGTCRRLNPAFNPLPLLEDYLTPLLHPDTDWKSLSKNVLLGSRDLQTVAQTLPRQLHWFFKRLASNGYAVEVRSLWGEEEKKIQQQRIQVTSRVVFASTLLVSGALLLSLAGEKPGLTALGVGFLVLAFWSYWRRNRPV